MNKRGTPTETLVVILIAIIVIVILLVLFGNIISDKLANPIIP